MATTVEKFFLDTNILIYSFDTSSKTKRQKATKLIAQGLSSGMGVISHQVIQEFVSVATSNFKTGFDGNRLILYFEEVLFSLWKAYPDREMYINAIQLKDSMKFSWWDSLIIASALATGCKVLYS